MKETPKQQQLSQKKTDREEKICLCFFRKNSSIARVFFHSIPLQQSQRKSNTKRGKRLKRDLSLQTTTTTTTTTKHERTKERREQNAKSSWRTWPPLSPLLHFWCAPFRRRRLVGEGGGGGGAKEAPIR